MARTSRFVSVVSGAHSRPALAASLSTALAIAAAVVAFGAGATREDGAVTRPAVVPDWFWPVCDYYDRNPAVTPAFDLPGLYASAPPAATPRR